MVILAYSAGGAAAEAARKAGMKVRNNVAPIIVKGVIQKEVLATLKRIGTKIEIKILQRTIVRYVVPLASIAVGLGWNYLATKTVGKIARAHFIGRRKELGLD